MPDFYYFSRFKIMFCWSACCSGELLLILLSLVIHWFYTYVIYYDFLQLIGFLSSSSPSSVNRSLLKLTPGSFALTLAVLQCFLLAFKACHKHFLLQVGKWSVLQGALSLCKQNRIGNSWLGFSLMLE